MRYHLIAAHLQYILAIVEDELSPPYDYRNRSTPSLLPYLIHVEAGPFETEANKVGPSRKISVFEKTIDNMWWLVILVNPAIALATTGVLEIDTILASESNVLAVVGARAGGDWLRQLVTVDAIMVLAGGVLTAYVGVMGASIAIVYCY